MEHQHPLSQAYTYIRQQTPMQPAFGVVLGSGLSPIFDALHEAIDIPYTQIPGFQACTVPGHTGTLSMGYFNGTPIACLKGRPHAYEGLNPGAFVLPIRLLKLLGAPMVLMLNAAGALNPELAPGDLVLVHDHINLQPFNPLVGPNDDTIGPRFINMDVPYDPALREAFLQAAQQTQITLNPGVYLSVLGPNFETAAEIRAFRMLGADVIGMSTIPEVIVARHCGLRVVLISVISNMAAGLSNKPLSHELTLAGVHHALPTLTKLIRSWHHDYSGVTHS